MNFILEVKPYRSKRNIKIKATRKQSHEEEKAMIKARRNQRHARGAMQERKSKPQSNFHHNRKPHKQDNISSTEQLEMPSFKSLFETFLTSSLTLFGPPSSPTQRHKERACQEFPDYPLVGNKPEEFMTESLMVSSRALALLSRILWLFSGSRYWSLNIVDAWNMLEDRYLLIFLELSDKSWTPATTGAKSSGASSDSLHGCCRVERGSLCTSNVSSVLKPDVRSWRGPWLLQPFDLCSCFIELYCREDGENTKGELDRKGRVYSQGRGTEGDCSVTRSSVRGVAMVRVVSNGNTKFLSVKHVDQLNLPPGHYWKSKKRLTIILQAKENNCCKKSLLIDITDTNVLPQHIHFP
ncbi:uncharacterized protein BDR25DRAFT_350504 [Lindgomyces ingoldianus]|uniref:Uncharacterized protein n=1 Tax=Lindgomyces ingoldianus TaxID=673940 RepID=A0ACB6R748_9PLEO|nr:uncharacterized protein BDR25DRAFT_350504 [Lindgomyces ingoldianus]KAF2475094.1 hypothetical protein BDR25DRAFT_350504 [Lindgomyces ingoldianus]